MPWLLKMTLFIAAIMLVADLYVGWRMLHAADKLSFRLPWQYAPLVLLVSFYLLPAAGLFDFTISGEAYLLAYPSLIVYWFWFGLIISFQLATLFIVLDAVRFILSVTNTISPLNLNRWYGVAASWLIIILFLYTGVKMIRDSTCVQIETIAYEISDEFRALQSFRIVHISDLQGDEFTGREEIAAYIKKVNALNPDLVVFTGDLISYGTDFIDMAAEELSRVEATHGLYAVIGDHDYWAGVPNIKEAFERYGIPLLQDENKFLAVNGDSLLITGITEVYSRKIPRQDLEMLSQNASLSSFNIMISHQATAKVIDMAKQANYDMLLGGHTHGGQLYVPFLGMSFSAAEAETSYISGVYWVEDLLVNINNGLGFTLAPVRYDAPPNISVIDLK